MGQKILLNFSVNFPYFKFYENNLIPQILVYNENLTDFGYSLLSTKGKIGYFFSIFDPIYHQKAIYYVRIDLFVVNYEYFIGKILIFSSTFLVHI